MDKPNGFWRRLLRVAAIAYPLSLLAVLVSLRWIGERWWVTTTALYLPRWPFAAPLPLLALALALAGPRRLLITQAAALLLLIPLLGFTLSLPRHPAGANHLRILSLNVNGSASTPDELADEVLGIGADVAVFQEAHEAAASRRWRRSLPAYHVQESGQFILASRYPILEMVEPPKIPYRGVLRSPHFVRFRLLGPQGPFLVYVVHPPSPREGLSELYGDGLKAEIETGRILANVRAFGLITTVAGLRKAQMCNVAADANAAADPVIIAGDTNLPGLELGVRRVPGRVPGRLREGRQRIWVHVPVDQAPATLDAHRPRPGQRSLPVPALRGHPRDELRPPRRSSPTSSWRRRYR